MTKDQNKTPFAPTDPLEKIIFYALAERKIMTVIDGAGDTKALDFYLPDEDVYIEATAYYTARKIEQASRVNNLILIQGKRAAEFFAMIASRPAAPVTDDEKIRSVQLQSIKEVLEKSRDYAANRSSMKGDGRGTVIEHECIDALELLSDICSALQSHQAAAPVTDDAIGIIKSEIHKAKMALHNLEMYGTYESDQTKRQSRLDAFEAVLAALQPHKEQK